jgi:hypothetical protein
VVLTGRQGAFTLSVSTRREGLLMAVYLVERSLKGITMDQLGAAQKSAIETGRR